ncbi:hypothetical protein TrVFT333_001761 [Trichoderma virens FT-333]|nr:hypothetical protein TrVFT333_001761 [Trichoderma virens FT-333]
MFRGHGCTGIVISVIITITITMANHEEHERWMHEMQLRQIQFQQEARRTATPRFGPAVNGVLWRQILPVGDADNSLQTPIISIIDFPLKPGIDVRDESRPPRKLLDATLGYISSIPGFCGVEWGPRLDVEAGLVCFIYWDSIVAWHKFQHSLGFTPLIGLLSSSVSNRCAKFTGRISGDAGPEDAVGANSIVDVVSVTLCAQDVSSPERRSAFEERWKIFIALVKYGGSHDGLRHSHAVWLENNASMFADPTPAEAAAATISATFTSFLVWDESHYDSHCVEHLCDSLQTAQSFSHGNEPPSISRKTVQLVNQVQQQAHNPQQQPAALLTSLESILQGDIPRQCNPDLFNLREHARQVLNSSISDARARKRLFPIPSGSFISQGELYEGNTSVIPEWRGIQVPLNGYHLVDIVWMQLKRRSVKTQGPRIYNQLKNDMSTLPGFVKAFWARDVEDETKIAVLTVWEDQHAQEAASHDYHRILDDFVASSANLASPLTHQSLPMGRSSADSPWLAHVQYLELTCFYIPPGALERQLFRHAYGTFAQMAVPSQQGGVPTACRVISDAGGWQPVEATDGTDSQVFTAVLTWMSPAARLEWYEELFGSARWSYELFGHSLDALKILATRGVTTRFLALQGQ